MVNLGTACLIPMSLGVPSKKTLLLCLMYTSDELIQSLTPLKLRCRPRSLNVAYLSALQNTLFGLIYTKELKQ